MEELIKEAITTSKIITKNSCVEKITPVGGGCIHKAWCIHLQNGQRVFAKTNHISNFNMFRYECECLLNLRKYSNESFIYIPEPLELIQYNKISILCLTWIDFAQCTQKILGQGLALLHQSSSRENKKNFGWESEGFIGTNFQKKGWDTKWGDYFIKYRLEPQLKIARAWGLNIEDYKDLLVYFSSYLNSQKPKPSILHGDLWSGNCGTNENGLGCIYDPACYWGDREVDIAMTRLFGGFSSDFYHGYEEIWPLNKSSTERIELYNLYHLLNHANIFGGSYKESALRTIKKLRLDFKIKS